MGLYDGPCPNLLRFDKVLIFVPSACRSGLLQPSDLSSLSDGRSIACPIRMSIYIFLICNIYYLCCTCIDFYDLSAWGGCWFVAYIRRFIYKCVSFWLHRCCGEWEGWARKPVSHIGWVPVAVVTPTNPPRSVRMSCVIELFMALFVLSLCHFDISDGVGAFVIILSHISSFFIFISFKYNSIHLQVPSLNLRSLAFTEILSVCKPSYLYISFENMHRVLGNGFYDWFLGM